MVPFHIFPIFLHVQLSPVGRVVAPELMMAVQVRPSMEINIIVQSSPNTGRPFLSMALNPHYLVISCTEGRAGRVLVPT